MRKLNSTDYHMWLPPSPNQWYKEHENLDKDTKVSIINKKNHRTHPNIFIGTDL